METSRCIKCGLAIKWNDIHHWWSANWEYLDKDGMHDFDGTDEPWFDACPGSIDMLKEFPTYGKFAQSQVDYGSMVHKPMDELSALVDELLVSRKVDAP